MRFFNMGVSGRIVELYGRDTQAQQTDPAVAGKYEGTGDPADDADTPEESVEKKERQMDIQRAISSVPEQMRSVFILRDVHGLSVEETMSSALSSVRAISLSPRGMVSAK